MRRSIHRTHPTRSIRIERKTSVLQDKKMHQGIVTQITDIRSSLMRTILVPQAVLRWLSNTLQSSIKGRTLSVPIWRILGVLKLKVETKENQRGRCLPIMEFLPDGRSYSLCIPEGKQSYGWTTFHIEIVAKLWAETPAPSPTSQTNLTVTTSEITTQPQNPQQFAKIRHGRTPRKLSYIRIQTRWTQLAKCIVCDLIEPQRTLKQLPLP